MTRAKKIMSVVLLAGVATAGVAAWTSGQSTSAQEPEPPWPTWVDRETGIVDQTKLPESLKGEFQAPTDPPPLGTP
jgi:hypothetical protein